MKKEQSGDGFFPNLEAFHQHIKCVIIFTNMLKYAKICINHYSSREGIYIYIYLYIYINNNTGYLRLTNRDETKDFQEIVREQNEITIYQSNLQVSITEVYKNGNSIAPLIMNSLFQFRHNTNSIRNF